MYKLIYYFGQYEDDIYEFEITEDEVHNFAKQRLLEMSVEELVDIILNENSECDLFDRFYDELVDEFQSEAREFYNGNY